MNKIEITTAFMIVSLISLMIQFYAMEKKKSKLVIISYGSCMITGIIGFLFTLN